MCVCVHRHIHDNRLDSKFTWNIISERKYMHSLRLHKGNFLANDFYSFLALKCILQCLAHYS